ncbi:MAG: S-layer homology domain-containing protein, partial [Vallitaleaceae bacterium]|nr:S-layer homology domain-containing protein [Vallitaleaceae bacterium]
MKRFLSFFLVLTILVSLSSEAQAAQSSKWVTSDMVGKDAWSYEALSAAVDVGLLEGDFGQIKPYDKMTRAEMITMILRALGLDDSLGQDFTSFQADIKDFKDVKQSDWFYQEMGMAYRLKLIDGISDTKMSPKGIVTREQAFTVLSRLMSLNTNTTDTAVLSRFTDKETVSAWARPYVATMVTAGYVSGYNNRLNPSAPISRQDFAQIMYNLFHRNYIKNQIQANTLEGENISGNLVVSAGNVALKNISVTGDVIIGDGVGNGNVTLDHVAIAGRLIVRGGGDHSIYLKSTTAKTIIVSKLSDGGIRVFGDDGSEVSYMEIPDGKDTVIIECDVLNLMLSDNDLDIVVNKTVENMTLSGDNIHVSGPGHVGTI